MSWDLWIIFTSFFLPQVFTSSRNVVLGRITLSLSYFPYFFPFLFEHVEAYCSYLLKAQICISQCNSVRVIVTLLDQLIQLGIVMSIISTNFLFLTLYLFLLQVHTFLKLLHEGCIISLGFCQLPLDAFSKGFGGYSALSPLDEIIQTVPSFIMTYIPNQDLTLHFLAPYLVLLGAFSILQILQLSVAGFDIPYQLQQFGCNHLGFLHIAFQHHIVFGQFLVYYPLCLLLRGQWYLLPMV